MYKYIVQYQHERDNQKHYQILEFSASKTWRELQNHFDPRYRYDNLKFYSLGSEVPFTG